ncbi:MAG: phosphocholine cytidylyltransferase family protein [Eubacterium sp.]|nr:phosphocholine cytidylyltransferase family protein [Eubacterium sp.]
MHKVERAIIMAAGMGTRLKPATDDTPKPMVKVNGVRMIDTVIDALHANGINEIHIVTGYLAGRFSEVKQKYPDVDILYNPYYETRNNISSMFVAREYLQNAICVDGDQIIYNPEILSPYFDYSGYAGSLLHDETDEWVMQTDELGIVTSASIGGNHGWQLFGISRWTSEDGLKLKRYIEEEYLVKKNYDIWWDNIPLFIHPEDFKLKVRRIMKGDLKEIDNFYELIEVCGRDVRKAG